MTGLLSGALLGALILVSPPQARDAVQIAITLVVLTTLLSGRLAGLVRGVVYGLTSLCVVFLLASTVRSRMPILMPSTIFTQCMLVVAVAALGGAGYHGALTRGGTLRRRIAIRG